MATAKAERILRMLLIATIVAAVLGAGLLVFQASSTEIALFELLAFSVSITALTLATLNGISNLHQIRTVRKIAREVHDAVEELRDIDRDNEVIKRKITQDYALVKDIIEALSDAGIGNDDADRQHIAGKIENRIRKV